MTEHWLTSFELFLRKQIIPVLLPIRPTTLRVCCYDVILTCCCSNVMIRLFKNVKVNTKSSFFCPCMWKHVCMLDYCVITETCCIFFYWLYKYVLCYPNTPTQMRMSSAHDSCKEEWKNIIISDFLVEMAFLLSCTPAYQFSRIPSWLEGITSSIQFSYAFQLLGDGKERNSIYTQPTHDIRITLLRRHF